jgi:hypothetical protein
MGLKLSLKRSKFVFMRSGKGSKFLLMRMEQRQQPYAGDRLMWGLEFRTSRREIMSRLSRGENPTGIALLLLERDEGTAY